MKLMLNLIQPLVLVKLFKYMAHYTFIDSPSNMIIYELDVPKHTKLDFDVIPNGCVQYIWGYNRDRTNSSYFTIIGAQKQRKTVILDGYTNYFCVQFSPNTFYYNEELLIELTLLSNTSSKKNIYPSIFFNKILSFTTDESILQTENNLIRAFKESSDSAFKHRLELFLQYIQTNLNVSCVPGSVYHTLKRTNEETGLILVSRLAEELCYSVRHTNKLLVDSLGFGPKDFCKYIRFQSVLNEILSNPNRNNSEFIYNIGYSDQAHFQREFKIFTGLTPKQFIKLQSQIEPKF